MDLCGVVLSHYLDLFGVVWWCVGDIVMDSRFYVFCYLVIFSGSAQPIRKYVSWVYCWLV